MAKRKKKAVKKKRLKKAKKKRSTKKKAKRKTSKKHTMHGCKICKKHWVGPPDLPHVCIPPSEERVFELAAENVAEAFEELKEFAQDLGEQRIYASQSAVMFARKICYMFVRPKPKFLELSLFLKGTPKHPLIHKTVKTSKTRNGHVIRITHRDLIEEPLTDWIRESFETCSGNQ